ncbi:hypothetical protein J5751_05015 [bacterium]|nr:hypothetical protein [bacterium]
MENRFHFRLFDIQEKKYIKDFVIDKDGNIFFINLRKDFIKLDKDRFKLMQSTGLVDKNGKEIYEMDILTDGSIKYLVKFDEERAWFIMQPILREKTLLTDYEELGKRYMHYYEIIGNIYENKELLGE